MFISEIWSLRLFIHRQLPDYVDYDSHNFKAKIILRIRSDRKIINKPKTQSNLNDLYKKLHLAHTLFVNYMHE